jgi:hypothetical protein
VSANLQLSSRIEPMANDRSASEAWVKRVLGVSMTAGAGDAPAATVAKPLQTWLDAKEAAGVQIGNLQEAMRGLGPPVFARIADQGLNGITGRLQVGLQVALINAEQATGAAREVARRKAREAVADFRAFLKNDPVVPMLDANPLGVTVTLQSGMGQALDAIDRALAG